MDLFLPCLYSFLACIGFCLLYNIRGKMLVIASIGGALGWFIFLISANAGNDITQYFIAMIVISLYSEFMARRYKKPVTVFLIVALIPLVPGGSIYRTMEYCINGETMKFLETGIHTIGIAGALALGILIVSSFVRLYYRILRLKSKTSF